MCTVEEVPHVSFAERLALYNQGTKPIFPAEYYAPSFTSRKRARSFNERHPGITPPHVVFNAEILPPSPVSKRERLRHMTILKPLKPEIPKPEYHAFKEGFEYFSRLIGMTLPRSRSFDRKESIERFNLEKQASQERFEKEREEEKQKREYNIPKDLPIFPKVASYRSDAVMQILV